MHDAYARTQMWNAKISYSISTCKILPCSEEGWTCGMSLHHFTHINNRLINTYIILCDGQAPRDFSTTVVLKMGLDLGVLIAAGTGVIIVT